MEAVSQNKPEAGDGAEAEDIPSDFFDDFNKADFIEGLSVVDSWDDNDKERNYKSDRPRFNAEVFDKVKDIRELLSDDKPKREGSYDNRSKGGIFSDEKRYSSKYEPPRQRRSSSNSRLDEFIRPGSRRDPNKTNEAIRRDKEEKVKEFLAKSLESSDDLRPPGTELDDYFDGNKQAERKTQIAFEPLPHKPRSRSRERRRESPRKQQHRRSPKWSPRRSPLRRKISRSPRRSPKRSPKRSPRRNTNTWRPMSPIRNPGYNRFKRYSPLRRSPRRSPRRHSPRHSPRRSPRPARRSRSRSPYRRPRRSRSPASRDNFLYPSDHEMPPNFGPPTHYQMPPQFGPPSDYPSGPPPSGYPPYAPAYGGYVAPYDYGAPPMPIPQPIPPPVNPVPAPVPIPVPAPIHPVLPVPNPMPPTVHIPAMVPAPKTPLKPAAVGTPYDALAKLVAEGKISKEDYLKLAPNKGTISSSNDKNRVMVLNRCSSALSKLKTLDLPNQLLLNHAIQLGPEPKYIAPKFCSPLKREAPVQFQFTSINGPSKSQQNKHLIDSIIAAVGLEKVVSRPKKKMSKNTKDAASQTSKPFCDVCEIRAATTTNVASTAIDRDHFCSSVHTQVVEQDLVSSKSIFNPSGSVGDGASMSIAHLTPAQLVSQLAARAKTLKNPEPAPSNQYRRNQDYEYDNRGGQSQQYHNYNNYRY